MKKMRYLYRAVVFSIGLTLLVLGIALLVLPGPGLLVLFWGLVVLGSEFLWARSLLKKIQEKWTNRKKNGNHF